MASALQTSLTDGVDSSGHPSLDVRREVFGTNSLPEQPSKGFFTLWLQALRDPIIIMLMAAALVSTILGAAVPSQREENAWSEGIAIWVAVLVVSLVGAGNDWHKDKQFKRLNAQKDIIDVKVVRDGQNMIIKNTQVLVGDIMLLDAGDKVVADGYVTQSFGLTLDEASLTGESDPAKKAIDTDPWVRSGTQVTEGSGRILVTAVGQHSEWGRTMALVVGEVGETPLQEKLTVLASAIGKVGLVVAVISFVVLMIRWIVENKGFPFSKFATGPLQFFIFAITIVVVAVPEGLPLAVTISLAYSMGKMMKDNNFVRVLAACETMGGATAICSDKTGTLTENRMTVVEGWFAGVQTDNVPSLFASTSATSRSPKRGESPCPPPPLRHQQHVLTSPTARDIIVENCALNSKAFLNIKHAEAGMVHGPEDKRTSIEFVGNRTECALLMMLRSWGIDYQQVRDLHSASIIKVYGFTSERKMSSVLVKHSNSVLRLYTKGAADWVVDQCSGMLAPRNSSSGSNLKKLKSILPLDDQRREQLKALVVDMASRGLRTLCLAYTDYPAEDPLRPAGFFDTPPEKDLTVTCIVGIKDPVRAEVPAAVATCQRAGIRVRMVTGDNIHTASHIARECGILEEDSIAMEGPEFRGMDEEHMMELLPRLRVLARSSPKDKYTLVQMLQKIGDVVAVTGDGTNDAPALKESDVGLAMGIAGTEVAKQAADIVILDDNFSSIVKAVLWGRAVFNNIRKFLQFQLTINLVALIIAFIAAVTTGETPLNVLQLLWVNLIMDSLAALALATEDPTPDLLERRPLGRNEPLINGTMGKHILAQGVYQCFWLFLIFYGVPAQLPAYAVHPCNYLGTGETDSECATRQTQEREKTNSLVFNTFIWMQLFNEVNSRRINDELNVFSGIFKGWIFPSIMALVVGFQVIIMCVPAVGNIFSVRTQSAGEWGVALGIGAGSLIVSFATKIGSRMVVKVRGAKPVQSEEELRFASIQPVVYREHFWQILRPPKPKK